jgi:hypothetical protein
MYHHLLWRYTRRHWVQDHLDRVKWGKCTIGNVLNRIDSDSVTPWTRGKAEEKTVLHSCGTTNIPSYDSDTGSYKNHRGSLYPGCGLYILVHNPREPMHQIQVSLSKTDWNQSESRITAGLYLQILWLVSGLLLNAVKSWHSVQDMRLPWRPKSPFWNKQLLWLHIDPVSPKSCCLSIIVHRFRSLPLSF